MYAMETFASLVDGAGFMVVSGAHITDSPSFVHRGVMVDTGRRFWPVATVEELLNSMAALKLNVLHFHASDYCRESVASVQFPNLTASLTGVWAGSYAQSDVQGLIAYAADRGIRLVPEFDLPGHSKGFDPIASDGLQFCSSEGAQIFNDPGNKSLDVVETFLDEMVPLFDDALFHVGCDETTVQGECSLASTAAMETAVFQLLESKGRTPAAWEEALFSTSSAIPGTVIYAWSQHTAPEVVQRGFQAVESHSAWFYLNILSTPAAQLWADIAPGLTPAQRALVLGGEVSMWTDDFCLYTECLEPATQPAGYALFPPTEDSAFHTAVLSIIFPRAIVGAGSFYRYDSTLNATSLDFERIYNLVSDRMLSRNLTVCPESCTCDYNQRCGNYYTPCDLPSAGQNVATYACPQAASAVMSYT
jgi:hexosaminidase